LISIIKQTANLRSDSSLENAPAAQLGQMTFGRKIGGNGTKREHNYGAQKPRQLSSDDVHKLEGDESRRVQLLEAQNQAAYYTIGSFLILSNHQCRSKGLPMATALKEVANCSQEAP
jgi:hypothetical protein